jgi:Fic family protein
MGNYPGCHMYDNHIKALNFALSDGWELSESTPLDIHRFLTRGIPYFEERNSSGQYRNVDVWIGHELCPNSLLIPSLMERWYKFAKDIMKEVENGSINPLDAALYIHHFFQVVHPFIDGNGRTGRLLIQKILNDLGEDPIIISFDNRAEYYDSIQYFRDSYWINNSLDYDKILTDLKMGNLLNDFQL